MTVFQMPQEQYTHRSAMQSSEGPHVYKVGIYGWRKRCLYFFVLLLMILILVNLAMTIWILKVMNFTIDGMGNLRITEKGLKLEGDSEFLKPLYAKEIRSKTGSPLYFQSARNVTVNILNEESKVLTRLVTGPKSVEAYSQIFQVLTTSGKLLFSADENEVVVGAERLKVLARMVIAKHWKSEKSLKKDWWIDKVIDIKDMDKLTFLLKKNDGRLVKETDWSCLEDYLKKQSKGIKKNK
ncbi:delta-sarcoglycan isoform X4 [Anolis carolinensis]|uniref:delta-sarcoglycan isoform X4 n=1 Tax=Anolis carolinensis TaxID=28377 RepID=UPI002F2B64BC